MWFMALSAQNDIKHLIQCRYFEPTVPQEGSAWVDWTWYTTNLCLMQILNQILQSWRLVSLVKFCGFMLTLKLAPNCQCLKAAERPTAKQCGQVCSDHNLIRATITSWFQLPNLSQWTVSSCFKFLFVNLTRGWRFRAWNAAALILRCLNETKLSIVILIQDFNLRSHVQVAFIPTPSLPERAGKEGVRRLQEMKM